MDNLGSLCRTDNVAKHRQGWRVTRQRDGTVGWHHPRTGLTMKTVPWATLRATARRRPPPHPDRHGTGPPGHPPDPPAHTPDGRDLPDRRGRHSQAPSHPPDGPDPPHPSEAGDLPF